MRITDSQLVRRLQANDRAAFEEIVERYYGPVYRQLWHLCGQAETAADLTQETFVQA
jgi:RNA polymerase sigma-70 factor (ECF subfamily)